MVRSTPKKLVSPTHPTLNLAHPTPPTFTWNTLIRSHPTHPPASVYTRMRLHAVPPDLYTFPFLLSSLPSPPPSPSPLHSHILLLGLLSHPFTLSSLISSYSLSGSLPPALQLFREAPGPDLACYNSVISSCLRAGRLALARNLFDAMPQRNALTWTCMIDGHVKSGGYGSALRLFRDMQRASVRPNHFTVSAVLAACARSGALEQGKWAHAYAERCGVKVDAVVGSALIYMYCRCGCVERAVQVFDGLGAERDVAAWSAMVYGFALHGLVDECFALFHRMRCQASVWPNAVTFLGVLRACVHAGLVREGEEYFESMTRDFGIVPSIQHYGCIVDLYARTGLIGRAWDVVNSMPVKPDVPIWGSILSGSRTHGDIEMCESSIKNLIELDPKNNSAYVLLSNVYAKLGRWEDVRAVRKLMEEMGVKKTPGCSIVELDGHLHEFFVGDKMHPERREIYWMLDEIMERLKLAGYVVKTEEVLLDLDEEGKEMALAVHSEKIAVAFSFIKTKPGTTVRIIKNLRICGDCHEAMNLISKVYGREIVVRDCSRFHHFRDGVCSCIGFW